MENGTPVVEYWKAKRLLANFMEYKEPTNNRFIDHTGKDKFVSNLFSDYNSLMSIVDKIEAYGANVHIVNRTCNIRLGFMFNVFKVTESKTQSIQEACVEFVKWYEKMTFSPIKNE